MSFMVDTFKTLDEIWPAVQKAVFCTILGSFDFSKETLLLKFFAFSSKARSFLFINISTEVIGIIKY